MLVRKIKSSNKLHILEEILSSAKKIQELPDPSSAWKNVLRRAKLTTVEEICILKELAEWREIIASKRNILPSFLIRDDSLVSMALIASNSEFATAGGEDKLLTSKLLGRIYSIQDLKQSTITMFKTDLIRSIKNAWSLANEYNNLNVQEGALKPTITEYLDTKYGATISPESTKVVHPNQANLDTLVDLLSVYLRQICKEHGITYQVLTNDSKAEVINLATCTKKELIGLNSIFTNTWRSELLGDDVFLIGEGLASLVCIQ